jgi:hypothetical protein
MKYEIKNKRLMEVIKKYMDINIQPIHLPLKRRTVSGQGNSGYGSGLDDYTYYNFYYFDETNDEVIFTENDSRYRWNDTRWMVNPILEPLYDFFGEEPFEEFVKYHFGFDITDKGNKDLNWQFD